MEEIVERSGCVGILDYKSKDALQQAACLLFVNSARRKVWPALGEVCSNSSGGEVPARITGQAANDNICCGAVLVFFDFIR